MPETGQLREKCSEGKAMRGQMVFGTHTESSRFFSIYKKTPGSGRAHVHSPSNRSYIFLNHGGGIRSVPFKKTNERRVQHRSVC